MGGAYQSMSPAVKPEEKGCRKLLDKASDVGLMGWAMHDGRSSGRPSSSTKGNGRSGRGSDKLSLAARHRRRDSKSTALYRDLSHCCVHVVWEKGGRRCGYPPAGSTQIPHQEYLPTDLGTQKRSNRPSSPSVACSMHPWHPWHPWRPHDAHLCL